MTPLAQLRALAEQLPPGAAVTLTKECLLALTAELEAARPLAVAEPVFTVATLATHLHRSRSTIRAWCERGERNKGLAATRVNGRWYITLEAVERFLGGPQPPAPPEPEANIGDWRKLRGLKP